MLDVQHEPRVVVVRPARAWEESSKHRVIVVEDDELYLEILQATLEDRGFVVQGFPDGKSLLKALDLAAEADVVSLDWMLPGMSGIDLLSRLRKRGITAPVVFLTGRPLVENEGVALARGAVDFMDKTRGTELVAKRLARIVDRQWNLHRRRPDKPIVCGHLLLSPGNRSVEWRGQAVRLTLGEYDIVSLLASSAGEPVTFRTIYDQMHYVGFVAGKGVDGYLVNVRSAMRRIRSKFIAVDPEFAQIRTFSGIGYCWRKAAVGDDSLPGDIAAD